MGFGLRDERWVEAVTAGRRPARRGHGGGTGRPRTREAVPVHAPERVLFVDELPRNASGKILNRELRDRFADR